MFVKIVAVVLCVTVAYVNAGCKDVPNVGDLAIGESKPTRGLCAIVTCTGEGSVAMKGCPEFVVSPPCKRIDENNELLYPDCCPKPWCPKKTEE